MRTAPLMLLLITFLSVPGCNTGEVNLLTKQVEELKVENAKLRDQLQEANTQIAKLEAIEQQRTAQFESIKQLVPDANELKKIMDSAKALGLPALKDIDQEGLLEKAKAGLRKAAESQNTVNEES